MEIPFFGVQTPRGQGQRIQECKTPQNEMEKTSIFSIAAKQASRWQTHAPTGISATNWMGAPSTEDPQLTSKVVFLAVKQERFDESGLMALATWITCDLSLTTRIDELVEWVSTSSEEELESDDDVVDESSSSESESGACGVVGATGS